MRRHASVYKSSMALASAALSTNWRGGDWMSYGGVDIVECGIFIGRQRTRLKICTSRTAFICRDVEITLPCVNLLIPLVGRTLVSCCCGCVLGVGVGVGCVVSRGGLCGCVEEWLLYCFAVRTLGKHRGCEASSVEVEAPKGLEEGLRAPPCDLGVG